MSGTDKSPIKFARTPRYCTTAWHTVLTDVYERLRARVVTSGDTLAGTFIALSSVKIYTSSAVIRGFTSAGGDNNGLTISSGLNRISASGDDAKVGLWAKGVKYIESIVGNGIQNVALYKAEGSPTTDYFNIDAPDLAERWSSSAPAVIRVPQISNPRREIDVVITAAVRVDLSAVNIGLMGMTRAEAWTTANLQPFFVGVSQDPNNTGQPLFWFTPINADGVSPTPPYIGTFMGGPAETNTGKPYAFACTTAGNTSVAGIPYKIIGCIGVASDVSGVWTSVSFQYPYGIGYGAIVRNAATNFTLPTGVNGAFSGTHCSVQFITGAITYFEGNYNNVTYRPLIGGTAYAAIDLEFLSGAAFKNEPTSWVAPYPVATVNPLSRGQASLTAGDSFMYGYSTAFRTGAPDIYVISTSGAFITWDLFGTVLWDSLRAAIKYPIWKG